MSLNKESYLINRYFNRNKLLHVNIELGIGDDCALLNIPKRQTLAISTDTLVCGRHFLPCINPEDLAHKALAASISDLAAMGAYPAWLTLALTLPEISEDWLKKFSDALFKQVDLYDMRIIGGDTTFGPLSITLAVYGFVPLGYAIKRSGAKPGDLIYVTNTIGDSAAGLAILQNNLVVKNNSDITYLLSRHLRPTPRIFHGMALRKIASAATDISDGLIPNLKHILKSSKVGALLNLDNLPISKAVIKNAKQEQALQWALTGGEDYELIFTIPAELNYSLINKAIGHLGVLFTCIGQILPENHGLQFMQNGSRITFKWKEHTHF